MSDAIRQSAAASIPRYANEMSGSRLLRLADTTSRCRSRRETPRGDAPALLDRPLVWLPKLVRPELATGLRLIRMKKIGNG